MLSLDNRESPPCIFYRGFLGRYWFLAMCNRFVLDKIKHFRRKLINLSAKVFQPNFVSLSSIFGRRPLFSLAVLFFLIGAIVAAVAKTPGELLVGRCIQGIGGGGIMSITEVMIADLIPMRQRGEFYGHMNAMWAVGSVCGPIIGGAFGGADIWVSVPFAWYS